MPRCPPIVTFGPSFFWKVNVPWLVSSPASKVAVIPAFFAAATEFIAPLFSASNLKSRALIAGFQSAAGAAGGTGAADAARTSARNMTQAPLEASNINGQIPNEATGVRDCLRLEFGRWGL